MSGIHAEWWEGSCAIGVHFKVAEVRRGRNTQCNALDLMVVHSCEKTRFVHRWLALEDFRRRHEVVGEPAMSLDWYWNIVSIEFLKLTLQDSV